MKTFGKFFFWSAAVQSVVLALAFAAHLELIIMPYWLVGLVLIEEFDRFISPNGIFSVVILFAIPIALVSAVVGMVAHIVTSRKRRLA